jgi:hypothetical protein
MIRNTGRKAARFYRCGRCHRGIEPGDYYVESVAAPNHGDIGNTGWWRDRECAYCADTYDRGHLIINRDFGLMDIATETRTW